MKRLKLTLLISTVITVSISGCSGGKLRNLLSRNDYQTLEEQNAEQSLTPGADEALVASAPTSSDDSFFKLPRFLGGKEESPSIAPDPFITASDTKPAAESDEALQARADERIAQEAQAAKTMLSDVEQQARELYENSQQEAADRFSPFGDQKEQLPEIVAKAQDDEVSQETDEASVFAELFGKQNATPENDVASPLIAQTEPQPDTGFGRPEPSLSEFDKILQAHDQEEQSPAAAIAVEPEKTSFEDFFAAAEKPEAQQPQEKDLFGSDFAFNETDSSSDSKSDFADFMNSKDDNDVSSKSDVWGKLKGDDQAKEFFAAAGQAETPEPSSNVFNDNFKQTAGDHGFANTTSPWESLPARSSTTAEVPKESGFSSVSAPLMSQPEAQNGVVINESEVISDRTESRSPFLPASQSQSATTSAMAEGQGTGLIIPASKSSESSDFFDLAGQPTAVQQISASSSLKDLPMLSTASAGEQGEEDGQSAANPAAGVAVQAPATSEGWTNRTWFLIIGCVLVAGLLFLPERQKR